MRKATSPPGYSLRLLLDFRLGFTSAHFSHLLACHLSLDWSLWAPFGVTLLIFYPPVLAISFIIASLSDVTPWCSLPWKVPREVSMPHCTTACTGVLSDEVLSTSMRPAGGTTAHLQPESSLCSVPSCAAVPPQRTRTEVVDVAAQSHVPCSSGDDASRLEVGHQQGKGVVLLCPALPWFSRSPACHQCCHTGLSEAEPLWDAAIILLDSGRAFLIGSGLIPNHVSSFWCHMITNLFHSLPALHPR